jgi:hypothetical protein
MRLGKKMSIVRYLISYANVVVLPATNTSGYNLEIKMYWKLRL